LTTADSFGYLYAQSEVINRILMTSPLASANSLVVIVLVGLITAFSGWRMAGAHSQ